MATSGTGLVDQERFNQTVQDFRIGMIRQMNNELIENTTMKDPLYIAGEEVFGKVKPYRYNPSTLSESFEGQRMNRSEEHTSEIPSLMRNSYDVFCLNKHTKSTHK